MITRRAFLAGAAALTGCRACASGPKKPIATVPYRFVYESKGSIDAFVPGLDVHHFIEVLDRVDGGWDKAVRSFTRATSKVETLARGNVDSYPILAVSRGCVWFRSEGKLARVPRTGGTITTHFMLPNESFPIAADADGAYAYRAHMVSGLALSTNVDLVHVTDAGEERVLASELFPNRETKIVTTKDDVIFWNTIKPGGVVTVSKKGGPPLETTRMYTKEIVQTGHTYRPESDGVFEVDPITGAKGKKLMPATSQNVLGVIGAGVVLEKTDYKSGSFGSRSAASYYALELYDTSAERRGDIFEMRPGSVLAAGEIPNGLVWATGKQIGELG